MSFVLTTIKVAAQNSAAGISVRSLEMFAVALFTRLCSTLFIVGYLPDDLSGRQVFQFFDVSSLAAVIRLLYVIHHNHQDTYDKEKDLHGIAWTIPASFLLAFFIHPTLNRSVVFDTIYTSATVLDTFCMLPQLYMMVNQGGRVCDLLTQLVGGARRRVLRHSRRDPPRRPEHPGQDVPWSFHHAAAHLCRLHDLLGQVAHRRRIVGCPPAGVSAKSKRP